MIAEGRVTLNGEVLASPAVNVTAEDRITVDGEPLPARERTRLWIFHKPRGLVTTARDPEGRPTVFENLPEDLPRVVAIGRLDINTEGLLLLTNDGGLARVIAHPETGWLRRYKVRAHGEVTQAELDQLRDGITIDGMEYGPVEARLDRVQGDNVWITMGLREGKNREVKRILEHLGLRGEPPHPPLLRPLPARRPRAGLVEEVRTKVLREQLGAKLAEEAGVDFESPVREPIAPFGSRRSRDRPRTATRRPRRDRERPRRRERRSAPTRRRPRPSAAAATRPRRGGAARAPAPAEPKRRVWRAGEDEEAPREGRKMPRRGADPRAERAASGARPRERVGAIVRRGPQGRGRAAGERAAGAGARAPRRRPHRGAASAATSAAPTRRPRPSAARAARAIGRSEAGRPALPAAVRDAGRGARARKAARRRHGRPRPRRAVGQRAARAGGPVGGREAVRPKRAGPKGPPRGRRP